MILARKLGFGLICLSAVVLGFMLLSQQKQAQRLPDGSLLYLRKVKLGATNEFTHGTLLEKILGRWLPFQRLNVGKFTLARTEKANFGIRWTTSLSAEFRLLLPKSGRSSLLEEQDPLTLRYLTNGGTVFPAWFDNKTPPTLRWVISGSDEMHYVQKYSEGWAQQKEGAFAYLNTSVFPRDSSLLSIRIETRDREGGDWGELAKFAVKNPAIAKIQPWSVSSTSSTKRVGDMEFRLEETTLRLEPENQHDIRSSTVQLPFRVLHDGVLETNWSADYMVIEDASGNADSISASKAVTDGRILYETWRSLDPKYVWRINVDFGMDSGWQPTNLWTVPIPILCVAPTKMQLDGVPVLIYFGRDGLWVAIDTVRKLSEEPLDPIIAAMMNNSGQPGADLRLTFICLNDQTGQKIGFAYSSFQQHDFHVGLFEAPVTGGTVTFAMDVNYHAEFYTKPRLLRSAHTKAHAEGLRQAIGQDH